MDGSNPTAHLSKPYLDESNPSNKAYYGVQVQASAARLRACLQGARNRVQRMDSCPPFEQPIAYRAARGLPLCAA